MPSQMVWGKESLLDWSDGRAMAPPLSMGFPRQEYWNGLPFPSLGDLPEPGIEPVLPTLAGEVFTTELPGKLLAQGRYSGNRMN